MSSSGIMVQERAKGCERLSSYRCSSRIAHSVCAIAWSWLTIHCHAAGTWVSSRWGSSRRKSSRRERPVLASVACKHLEPRVLACVGTSGESEDRGDGVSEC